MLTPLLRFLYLHKALDYNTIGVSSFANIVGVTAFSYIIANAQASASGNQYRVIVTNECDNITSTVASLTVSSAPGLPGSINGETSVCANSTQTYSIDPVANDSY